ncbi:carbohydrate-binding protein [Paenibacillus sp. JNUCC31]|uniref:carbohydrate-binding protein n=1 Tax=Paenibacillus sp. JNUCC-31 TaxID=2777983 RepID=UPI001783A0D4|nr:carbohydrate-binding protein [Paenibacillus sp. JNUCC-31]QOS79229.1 carbohydrate-binding protein [Paenibacillus sp. JNUCC-31]
MIHLTIEVQSKDGITLAEHTDTNHTHLVYEYPYQPGDSIVLRSSEANVYLYIQLDDAINPAFVYYSGQEYRLSIPFDEKKASYSPKSFTGKMHLLTARVAALHEITSYKNVAANAYDHHTNLSLYPHASANVETRGEAVFAARNAINGNTVTYSHGGWPFESWGINQRKDAEFTVHFGRLVEIDKIVLYLRADFPHDNYWEQVTLHFSDGSSQMASLVKSGKAQTILLEPKQVEWVKLSELIQSNDPALFPALTQFEAYGQEVQVTDDVT